MRFSMRAQHEGRRYAKRTAACGPRLMQLRATLQTVRGYKRHIDLLWSKMTVSQLKQN